MDDNKKSTTIWLRPSVISRMDGWLEADNCQSRSEFVDKALRFYMGYLGTEDNTTYISQAILTAIQGTMDLNNHRLQTILFKCAVELNMLCHTIAAHFRADPMANSSATGLPSASATFFAVAGYAEHPRSIRATVSFVILTCLASSDSDQPLSRRAALIASIFPFTMFCSFRLILERNRKSRRADAPLPCLG